MKKKIITGILFAAAVSFAGYKYHSNIEEPSFNLHKANIEAIADDDEKDGYSVVIYSDASHTICVCGGKGTKVCCY